MTDIEEEIARRLAEWRSGEHAEPWEVDMYMDAAAALTPLLNRVRAEALREHGRAVAYWERGHSPKVLSHSVERIVADLEVRAAAIEQNSEGNET